MQIYSTLIVNYFLHLCTEKRPMSVACTQPIFCIISPATILIHMSTTNKKYGTPIVEYGRNYFPVRKYNIKYFNAN